MKSKSILKILIVIIYGTIPLLSYSQAGSLDYTFQGLTLNQTGSITSFGEQSDGKIIVVGNFYFTSVNGITVPRIARLNIDGSVDTVFNSNVGTGFAINTNVHINKVIIQPDDKIIIGGTFPTFNGVLKNSILRLNSDGTIDNTFNTGNGFEMPNPYMGPFQPPLVTGSIRDMELKSNGEIVISGGFTKFNNIDSDQTKKILILNSNGTLNSSFNAFSAVGSNGTVFKFDIQPDNKIIFYVQITVATYSATNRHTRMFLRRLNSNGSIDGTFTLNNTIIREDNIGGNLQNNYNANVHIWDIKCLNNNKILIGGNFDNTFGSNKDISRLNANGTVDNTFSSLGADSLNEINTIDIQNDDKILIGGNFNSFNNSISSRIARLNANGSFDNTFNVNNGFTGTGNFYVSDLKIVTSNKVLAVGNFENFNSVSRNSIARINLSCNYSPTFDLMVKDGADDIGSEPNNITPYMWASTDIWIRNQADGIDEHQNPEYSSTVPNYGYVRVTNKSCVTSTGNDQLKLYWAKAGTSLSWPDSWDGNNYFPAPNNTAKLGAPIGTVIIPVLYPGQEIVLQFEFLVPNPDDYSFAGSDAWHFCLLSRIESSNDPSNETSDLYSNVQNNNNIAWKNISIVDLVSDNLPVAPGAIIGVGNPYDEPRTFQLELLIDEKELENPIYKEAEVTLNLDQTLLNAWIIGGEELNNMINTKDDKKKIVIDNNAFLGNITFEAKEIGTLNLTFNFLTEELSNKSKYVYHVIQRDIETGKIIGGETYIINKNSREAFMAYAGDDKEVDKNEMITISAEQISEPAIYNWYDENGNLIYEGKDLTVSADVVKKYKLEIIALADGFKDYSEIEIKFKPSILSNITPNPASNIVNISYKTNDVSSAYLMIIGTYGVNNTSYNYILDINNTNINLDISNYQNGLYTIALVCDGEIIDAKSLLKQ